MFSYKQLFVFKTNLLLRGRSMDMQQQTKDWSANKVKGSQLWPNNPRKPPGYFVCPQQELPPSLQIPFAVRL